MSRRSQLRAALKGRLSGIRKGQSVQILHGSTHAFGTDIGLRVFPWRLSEVDPASEIPCCGFADTEAPANMTDVSMGWQGYALRFELTALVNVAEAANPSETLESLAEEATRALADVLAAIGVDPHWGDVDSSIEAATELSGAHIELDPMGGRQAAAIVDFTIHYQAPLWQL